MGRRNQKNEPLDRVGPATAYPNQAGAYADDSSDQGDGNQRHCLDARSSFAEGAATYGQTRTNVSYRHGSIRP